MKLRFFTFLVSFLMVMSGAVWGQEVIDITNIENGQKDWGNVFSDVIRFEKNGEYTITGKTSTRRIDIGFKNNPDLCPTNITLNLSNLDIITENLEHAPIWIHNEKKSNVKIVIKGNNTLTADAYCAIDLNENVDLTIEGSGILEVTGKEAAIGCSDVQQEYNIGHVTITGGTVIATGKEGTAIGSSGDSNVLTIAGNAFVILDGKDAMNPDFKQGIYYNMTGGNNIANVLGNITLSSTYPNVDWLEGLILDIADNGSLTIGEGFYVPKKAIKDEDKDKVNAYSPIYIPNYLSEDIPDGGSNEKRLSENYWGPNTQINGLRDLVCGNEKHHFLGWCDDNKDFVVGETYTTPQDTPTKIDEINLNGVWADIVRDIDITTQLNITPFTFNIFPKAFTENISATLSSGNLPKGLTLTGLTISGTATDDSEVTIAGNPHVVKYNLKAGSRNEKEVTLNFNISSEKATIISASVKIMPKNEIYDSQSHVNDVLDFVTKDNRTVAFGVHYEIKSMDFKPTGSDNVVESRTDIIDAGEYSNIVLVPGKGSQAAAIPGGEINVTGIVTIDPYTISVIPDEGQSCIEGEEPEIKYTLYPEKPYGQTPKLKEGSKLTIDDFNSPGVKDIKGGNFSFENNGIFIASNYKPQITEEIFLVRDKLESNDIRISLSESAEGLTYDGKKHDQGLVVVNKNDGTQLNEGVDFKVSYKSKDGSEFSSSIKNAGEYTAKVSFIGEYAGEVEDEKVVILKRKVTLKGAEKTIELGSHLELEAAINPELLILENVVPEETPVYVGDITLSSNVDINTAGVYEKAFDISNVSLGTNKSFLASNYELKIESPSGILTVEGDGGGSVIDRHKLILIKSEGAKLSSRYNKMTTGDNGSFTVSLEKEPGYEDSEPTVYYKRGRYGEWQVLKFDEVSEYYQIRNVFSDIYVKVSGDGIWPVSNEEVEAQEVKVYTRNGAIAVSTPSLMDVQVISLTGSVVAADKVAGQREFRNLAEGVYIVRVGDKIVKVRL